MIAGPRKSIGLLPEAGENAGRRATTTPTAAIPRFTRVTKPA
jgi:hypothetical protein